MAFPLTGYINDWRGDYSDISNNLWSLGSYLKNAASALGVENFGQAAYNLSAAGDSCHVTSQLFSGGANNLYDDMYTAMHWIDGNMGDGEALTMDTILEAMWTSDKLRNFHFINYIDAMRASIWNTQINKQHLADWYKHFSE